MTHKITSLIVLFIWAEIQIFGQEKQKKNFPQAGLIIGLNMASFSRPNDKFMLLPNKAPAYKWQAGFSIDIFNTKKMGAKYEFVFTNKGGKEAFEDFLSSKLNSKVNLSYVQANLYPLIFKPIGNRNFNPFVSIGGYYAYLVSNKYLLSVNSLDFTKDELASKNTLKQDYGLAWNIGFDIKKFTLEYRTELGLPYVLNQKTTLSTIKNLNHSFVLTIR